MLKFDRLPILEGEIWQPAYAVEETHEVSNFGRCRTLDRTIIIKGSRGQPVERKVPSRLITAPHIYLERGCTHRMVWRMVLETFGDVKPLPENIKITFLDGDQKNRRFENLVWEEIPEKIGRKPKRAVPPVDRSIIDGIVVPISLEREFAIARENNHILLGRWK